MSEFSDIPVPEKPNRQERYARWMLKPSRSQRWMESKLGRYANLWILIIVVVALGANIYFWAKVGDWMPQPYEPAESVNWNVFDELQKAEANKLASDIFNVSFEAKKQTYINQLLTAKLAGIYLGIIAILISAHFERRGAQQLIARLEKQLAQAQAKAPE